MSAIELLESARRAFDVGNTDRALSFYEQALEADPNSWEAAFYTSSLRLLNIRKGQLADAIVMVKKNYGELNRMWLYAYGGLSKQIQPEIQDHLSRLVNFLEFFTDNLVLNNTDYLKENHYIDRLLHAVFNSYKHLSALAGAFAKGSPIAEDIFDLTAAFLGTHVTDIYLTTEEGFALLDSDVQELKKIILASHPQASLYDLDGLHERLEGKVKADKQEKNKEILNTLLVVLGPLVGIGLIVLIMYLLLEYL